MVEFTLSSLELLLCLISCWFGFLIEVLPSPVHSNPRISEDWQTINCKGAVLVYLDEAWFPISKASTNCFASLPAFLEGWKVGGGRSIWSVFHLKREVVPWAPFCGLLMTVLGTWVKAEIVWKSFVLKSFQKHRFLVDGEDAKPL